MKKALIIVCSCLLIAVVALCLVWSSLNGQKTELADKLEVSDRTLEMAVNEAKELEDGKKAAETLVAELQEKLTAAEALAAAAEDKAAAAEEALAAAQAEIEAQKKESEDQLKESAESIENAVTRAVNAEESAQALAEQLVAVEQSLQDVQNRADDAEQNVVILSEQLTQLSAQAETVLAQNTELAGINEALNLELDEVRTALTDAVAAKEEAEQKYNAVADSLRTLFALISPAPAEETPAEELIEEPEEIPDIEPEETAEDPAAEEAEPEEGEPADEVPETEEEPEEEPAADMPVEDAAAVE